ncbi:MAG: glutamate synthase subunit alpha [Desulfovibrio sp.]|jgi:glutamate synthase domain-containing protein 2/glutamate synthase domain-containing protein 1/glutamate synthase domain-containing protein 3|nr:glutamate synthase subunit alpha [Desulfovibrio sp.]
MQKTGLYDPQFEHDSCGVGFICYLDGEARHDVIRMGVQALCNLSHRGAAGADADTGDGAGILFRVPHVFLRRQLNCDLPPEGSYGLGMVFLPLEQKAAAQCLDLMKITATAEGFHILAWRDVPVNPDVLGDTARASRPRVCQFVVSDGSARDANALERRLYILRKCMERAVTKAGFSADSFYIPSLSSRTVVYKGMMMASQILGFYPDLADESLASTFAVVHQRYSTNTFPSWRLAHPFRWLAHNGEINTIRGNRNWLTARESGIASPLFGKNDRDIDKIFPLIEAESSDSANLDNAMEFLIRGGRGVDHSMAMLIPQAWGSKYPMGPDLRGFFEFHAGLMEPWDGPAAVVFTDGYRVGACLDRNGLRPTRYSQTKDGLVVLASEDGVLDLPADQVIKKGALRPGQMILADIVTGRLIENVELKGRLARLQPYRRWVDENRVEIPGFFSVDSDFTRSVESLPFLQCLFGYDRDDLDILLWPMAEKGIEPVGSMGADIPLSVLDARPRSLFSYFRQQFAQITNPPIDPIREALVMSLMTFIGYQANILQEEPGQARLIKFRHPILSNSDLQRLRENRSEGFACRTLDSTFVPLPGEKSGVALAKALSRLEEESRTAVQDGTGIIVISDKEAAAGRLPIPAILSTAAVARILRESGSVHVGLVCETGEAREGNHMALLLALGASAINPWLAFESVAAMAAHAGRQGGPSPTGAVENYTNALCSALRKIMSKMGISTLRSYRGAGIFEAVGLGPTLVNAYFPSISSRVGGIGLEHIEEASLRRRDMALDMAPDLPLRPLGGSFSEFSLDLTANKGEKAQGGETDFGWDGGSELAENPLPVGGAYRYRRDGEAHLWTPETITLLHTAVRNTDQTAYREYARLINKPQGQPFTLRHLLRFVPDPARSPLPLSEVEGADSIVRRFVTGAMSFGSLSKEAHETMALAMNSMGARSNSGEGGEDRERFKTLRDGGSLRSAIKQVASGRFGVTLEYMVNAGELQIKIAQGAKPGEGGHLPGHKVNAEIARVRNATPGVSLISPPPHHDIYSIEDIAQLIYDLRQANDVARVSVKLVSETGVGTIAAGAAKAMSDTILISGADGGTGAAPLSSIMHAGCPWEIGLAETQQTLVLNNLRGRVRLQADGQMKTGRDVAVACLLGADEFGFATAALVSMGCIMMRKCHTNGCPVGVATQDPAMRARFKGKPEHVRNFFHFVAEEVREIMAELGFRSMAEMTGQVERLALEPCAELPHTRHLDFSNLLLAPGGDARRYSGPPEGFVPAGKGLDDEILPFIEPALEKREPLVFERQVRNTDRTLGAKISSRIVRAKGMEGLPDDSIRLNLYGSAGQSFGAFAARGLTLHLRGAANDYVGKGLSGGRIIISLPENAAPDFVSHKNIIAGNVALYGATSGEMFLRGRAGERFAVRNSGATAVVEGVGDHGCDYLTGGLVVVLGLTGVNFAAGMSGGLAYVYDKDGLFDSRCNLEMVDLDLLTEADEAELQTLIEKHNAYTGSPLASKLLAGWQREKGRFLKVFPMEYRRVLGEMSVADAATPRREVGPV